MMKYRVARFDNGLQHHETAVSSGEFDSFYAAERCMERLARAGKCTIPQQFRAMSGTPFAVQENDGSDNVWELAKGPTQAEYDAQFHGEE